MRERGILMTATNVRSILAGTKTQTRRVVKCQHSGLPHMVGNSVAFLDNGRRTGPDQRCPYGTPGDWLWVRETWMDLRGTGIEPFTAAPTHYAYGADTLPGSYGDECRKQYGLKWRPSIHMPRLASRITLEITDVRVERLQEISEADAIAEGIIGIYAHARTNPRGAYRALWESINGPGSWDANPWVWALTFRRIDHA